MESIKNKKITIIGAGISGRGASKLASYLGAKVILTDINTFSNVRGLGPGW